MKSKLFCCFIILGVFSVAGAGELDGKKFCRTYETEQLFGMNPGKIKVTHCVSFQDDKMVDTADTIAGKPPKEFHYVFVSGKVLIVDQGKLLSPYSVNTIGDRLLGSSGAVLELE